LERDIGGTDGVTPVADFEGCGTDEITPR
jgi:hypothetical protein